MLWRGLGSILCRKKTTRNPTQPNSPQTPYSSRQTITPDSYTRQLRSTVKPDSYTRQLHATVTRDSYSRHFQRLRGGGGVTFRSPFCSASSEQLGRATSAIRVYTVYSTLFLCKLTHSHSHHGFLVLRYAPSWDCFNTLCQQNINAIFK